MLANRIPIHFNADPKKVILLYLDPGESERLPRFASFSSVLSDEEADKIHQHTLSLFGHRHRNFNAAVLENAHTGLKALNNGVVLNAKQKLVFGSYLTKEYSVEAAALFNPSIVPHPDQTGISPGETKFVLTLRSVGEGHISSIGFMEGVINDQHQIRFTEHGPWRTKGVKSTPPGGDDDHYDISFDDNIPLSERVIFPQAKSESMGMEDLRMIKFEEDDTVNYLGTFTAYNGREIQSKMLETKDFKHFLIRNLKGSEVDNKGIAFFPRKINGKYFVLSRQGGEKLAIMQSDDYMTWNFKQPLQAPTRDFELVQIGNCGSPIETPEGWLMITHHVGPVRRYTLGVTLLDLEQPHKVISMLKEPLMEPLENEREGYVPNVLYTCGWMQHLDSLLIPYAMSDVACGFATVKTKDLLAQLKADQAKK
jgi:predicted GH43/DUF377 family glycosyl hydrolase